jgi:hypothetical protein
MFADPFRGEILDGLWIWFQSVVVYENIRIVLLWIHHRIACASLLSDATDRE